jgi:predicted dehydrogenase
MKNIKIGLIGCGRIAPKHVEGYQQADNVHISALCAPRIEKAHALADEFGLQDVEFFTDYRDMLAQQDRVHAVDIMTPDYLHAPIVQDCAAAGLHMLCEKPMALNTQDASLMHKTAKEAGILAMVGLNMRFSPDVLTVKKLMDDGLLGDLFHYRARLTVSRLSNPHIPLEWRQERDKGGTGALSDLGAHLIDLARFLLNDEFSVVTGLGRIFIPTRTRPDTNEPGQVTAYDAASFSSRMSRGAMVNIEVSRFAAGANTFELDGSKGSIRFIDGKLYNWQKETTDHQKPSTEFNPIHVDPESFKPHEANIYAAFAHSIQTNTPTHPDFSDGLICQKVLDGVDESIRTGQVVSLEPIRKSSVE